MGTCERNDRERHCLLISKFLTVFELPALLVIVVPSGLQRQHMTLRQCEICSSVQSSWIQITDFLQWVTMLKPKNKVWI